MILELIENANNNNNGLQQTFTEIGGTIGRAKENDLVLDCPNKIISRKHARIYAIENDFFIEDTSSNGVYINNIDQPIGKSSCQIISSEDEIKIGSYLFKALIHKENKETLSSELAIHNSIEDLNIEGVSNTINLQTVTPPSQNIQSEFDEVIKANTSNHIHNPLGNIGDNFDAAPKNIANQATRKEIKPLKINNIEAKKQIIPDNWDSVENNIQQDMPDKDLANESVTSHENEPTIDQCMNQNKATDKHVNTVAEAPQQHASPAITANKTNAMIDETQAAAIQYLLSGMGINEEINLDDISPDQYYHLGKAVKVAISGAIVNKKWLEKSCSELCIDKQAIKRNQSGQFDYHSAEELLGTILTEKQNKHSTNVKLTNLYRDTIEDQKNIFNFVKDLITNIESDVNPLQLEIEMIEKENMNLKRPNGVEDFKGRLNPYKKKWEFMIENWSEYYQKSVIDIRRTFERQMVLSLVRRKTRDNNES